MAGRKKQSTESAVREIRRRTRRKFAPEEKIRIVLEGLRGEQSISELCRREGVGRDDLVRAIRANVQQMAATRRAGRMRKWRRSLAKRLGRPHAPGA